MLHTEWSSSLLTNCVYHKSAQSVCRCSRTEQRPGCSVFNKHVVNVYTLLVRVRCLQVLRVLFKPERSRQINGGRLFTVGQHERGEWEPSRCKYSTNSIRDRSHRKRPPNFSIPLSNHDHSSISLVTFQSRDKFVTVYSSVSTLPQCDVYSIVPGDGGQYSLPSARKLTSLSPQVNPCKGDLFIVLCCC